jgi:hypothetical protein
MVKDKRVKQKLNGSLNFACTAGCDLIDLPFSRPTDAASSEDAYEMNESWSIVGCVACVAGIIVAPCG